VAVSVPENLTEFCCGTPFSSKGLTRAYAKQVAKNAQMSLSLEGTQLIIDGSSCHQTLSAQVESPVLELSEFVAAELLDVPVKNRHDVIILHPTCSGVATGSNHAMETIARHIAKEVVIPTDWKCCGFAGDRGLLLPELTSNATALEAREVGNREGLLVSNNQPCQIGMSGATGRTYVSILEAWLQSVR
jgi:D-lactate dehydrogenase